VSLETELQDRTQQYLLMRAECASLRERIADLERVLERVALEFPDDNVAYRGVASFIRSLWTVSH
jgi:hypothetical protein